MKKLFDWWVPDQESSGIRDIMSEWNNKGLKSIQRCKARTTAIQAGGNLGVFPYYLASYFKDVITFEPVQAHWDCMARNLRSMQNITAYKYGLGEKAGSARIHKTLADNCGATQIVEDEEGVLKILALDQMNFEEVDLIWLDVEGFEVKALKGAQTTIATWSPVIVVENNGLIHEFPSDRNGSDDFRRWMKDTFNYNHVDRLMRDDIFVRNS